MSTSLRVLLIVSAALVFCFVVRKIKKSQMQVLDSLFWLLFSVSFVLLGVFPEIASYFSDVFGFISPSNLVFLHYGSSCQVGRAFEFSCSGCRSSFEGIV